MIKDIMNHNADAVAGQKEMDALKKYFPQCFHADGVFDRGFQGCIAWRNYHYG